MYARRESGSGVGGAAEVHIVVAVKEKSKSERFEVYRGSLTLFGAITHDGGVNFAIFSANVVSATLYLISLSDLHDVSEFAFFSFSLFGDQCKEIFCCLGAGFVVCYGISFFFLFLI